MNTTDVEPPAWCLEVIRDFQDTGNWKPRRVAELAQQLADSGECLARDSSARDVASTGGPASLTTMLPPIMLAASGFRVPKIGVPGRPAGAIDTLGVIPGYKTSLSRREFESAIHESGFANTLSTGVFAPDDSALFAARQQVGAQSLPPLVIASLLSKKLAAGLTRVVFDVRRMRGGNFGESRAETLTYVELLRQSAELLDIACHPTVTNGNIPPQPMVGRGEALKGLLLLLHDRATPWLENHFERCADLARTGISDSDVLQVDRNELRGVFDAHLRAQGADGIEAALEYIQGLDRDHPSATVHAPSAGKIHWDTATLRAVVVKGQRATATVGESHFPDACGVELLVASGSHVAQGAPVAQVRGITGDVLRDTLKGIGTSFAVLGSDDGGRM